MESFLIAVGGTVVIALFAIAYHLSRYDNDPWAGFDRLIFVAKVYAVSLVLIALFGSGSVFVGARWASALAVTVAVSLFGILGCAAGSRVADGLDRRDVENRMRSAERLVTAARAAHASTGTYPASMEIPRPLDAWWPSDSRRFLSPVRYVKDSSGGVTISFSDGWYDYYVAPTDGLWNSRD